MRPYLLVERDKLGWGKLSKKEGEIWLVYENVCAIISLLTLKRISVISQWTTFIRVLPTRWRRKPADIEITSQSPYVQGRLPVPTQLKENGHQDGHTVALWWLYSAENGHLGRWSTTDRPRYPPTVTLLLPFIARCFHGTRRPQAACCLATPNAWPRSIAAVDATFCALGDSYLRPQNCAFKVD